MNVREALEKALENRNMVAPFYAAEALAPTVEAALHAVATEMAERRRYDIPEHDLDVDVAASVTAGIATLAGQPWGN